MQPVYTSAWTDRRQQGRVSPDGLLADPERVRRWALADWPAVNRTLLRSRRRYEDWRDEGVGWGLVLPHDPALPLAKLATADDAPEPIAELVRRRRGPVLRYDHTRPEKLLDARIGQWLTIAGTPLGAAPGHIPFYLLIYGTPERLPWGLQSRLGVYRAVGRLDIEGQALANYVGALLDGWREHDADPRQIVAWAVDFGGDDITALMRAALVEPLVARLRRNDDQSELTIQRLGEAEPGTGLVLAAELGRRRPALVISSSHGQTEPLERPDELRTTLGLPVDQTMRVVSPADLLASWEPGGAIWYAHACCSAGCEAESVFRGLFDPARGVGQVLAGLERVGAVSAPLPRALLGAPRPLRAFIGHVEPTFNVTLAYEDPDSGALQRTTDDLVEALADGLYRDTPLPIGLALQTTWFRHTPNYRDAHQRVLRHLGSYPATDPPPEALVERALLLRLIAEDRSAMVILGDPTVTRPALPSERRW